MLLDANTLFSDAQSLVGTAGAMLSDKSIDLWSGQSSLPKDALGNTVISDPGMGEKVEVLAQVVEEFDSAGDAVTLVVDLVMADNEALSTNLVVLHSTPALAQSVLKPGYQFRIGGTLPPGVSKRFLGLRYTTAVADATAGKITAGLVRDRQTNPSVTA